MPNSSPAIVTGASRGFGRAIAAALTAAGTAVVGVARDEGALELAGKELGERFIAVAGDATDEALARRLIREYQPGLLVLNAGAAPYLAPLPEQTWETFSRNWHSDTRQAFTWTRAALRAPLAPGSTVVLMSSGAAIAGSPLSGGYASAKAALRYLRGYAAEESERARLGVRFVALLPQLTPATGLGQAAVAGYAARPSGDPGAYVAHLQPILPPELGAAAVLAVAADPASQPEYLVSGAGHRAL